MKNKFQIWLIRKKIRKAINVLSDVDKLLSIHTLSKPEKEKILRNLASSDDKYLFLSSMFSKHEE